MDTLDTIRTRRSIRQYEDQAITDATITTILRAAMAAPSADNAQTWEFVVVDDRDKLNAASELHPGAAMLKNAPLGIVVCGDPERESIPGFWPQDCSAATQNLLLAAHDQGLGAVWIGVYPMEPLLETVRQIFGIPPTVNPLCIVALGQPAEELPPEDRYDEKKIHHNQW